jgi:hypothetical protein
MHTTAPVRPIAPVCPISFIPGILIGLRSVVAPEDRADGLRGIVEPEDRARLR